MNILFKGQKGPGTSKTCTTAGALLAAFATLLAAVPAHAQEAASKIVPFSKDVEMSAADNAWVLASAALVLFMTPGLAFFYGGLVRGKNMLNTLLMSYGAMALMAMLWVACGYSIAFAPGNDYFGGMAYAGLSGVDTTSGLSPIAGTIPHQTFMIFQMMFFIITPALISGSLVERMKFSSYLVFIGLWGLLVYCPVAHWVWGGGFIGAKLGVLDFAGGAVVHVNAGFAALAGALALKPRKGYGESSMRPHNLPFCLLGVGMLWFGWYGFNAGSALGAGSLATVAFVNTTLGAASAMLVWMLIEQVARKEMTALGAGTGAVAGLVGITPAAGFVSPMGAIGVGAITACVCYVSATLRAKGKIDDSLDAFAVHGVGGFTGALLTGLFSYAAIGDAKIGGSGVSPFAVEGGIGQVIKQFEGTAIVAVYTFVVSFILFKIIDAVMGLRVMEDVEEGGLDTGLHGEEAYSA